MPASESRGFQPLGVETLAGGGQKPSSSFQLSFQQYSKGSGDANLHLGEGDFLRLEERERLSVDSGEVPQFDEVHATLSGFSLGDEGLGPRHEPRDFRLRQTSRFTGLLEALQKEPVFPNVVLGLQWLPRWTTRQLVQLSKPISQNRILLRMRERSVESGSPLLRLLDQ